MDGSRKEIERKRTIADENELINQESSIHDSSFSASFYGPMYENEKVATPLPTEPSIHEPEYDHRYWLVRETHAIAQ